MSTLRLVSFKLCPFVQRALIGLEEGGLSYQIEYLDPRDRPPWFTKLSPLGKVPLLLVDEVPIFESSIINEYIDEVTPGKRLLPADPLQRALHRGAIVLTSELLAGTYALSTAPTQEVARAAAGSLAALLEQLERRVRGPWFDESGFSLVDVAAAPALQRLSWCEAIEPSLNLLPPSPRLRAWRDALLERQSVRRSTLPELHDLFIDMLRGGASSPRGPCQPSWLGRLSLAR